MTATLHTPKRRSKKAPQSDEETHMAIIRAGLLKQTHGDPCKQKDGLVNRILNAFESVESWPMTDAERISLLRNLYNDAKRIRQTERAIAASRT